MKPGIELGELIGRVVFPTEVSYANPRWTPDAALQRFASYEQTHRSRLSHVSRSVGQDTPREHDRPRGGNRRG